MNCIHQISKCMNLQEYTTMFYNLPETNFLLSEGLVAVLPARLVHEATSFVSHSWGACENSEGLRHSDSSKACRRASCNAFLQGSFWQYQYFPNLPTAFI